MTAYRLDTERIRRGFDRAAAHYDEHALVQRLAREQLLERLSYFDIAPQLVVDAGAGTGQALAVLSARYPQARVLGVDSSAAMLCESRASRRASLIRADVRALPLGDSTVGLLFASLLLPWCDDLDAVLAETRRVMAAPGLFLFATLGPDTLIELRRAWRAADTHEHVHGFIDMHDIGDALLRAGFAEPVLDVERLTLTYSNLRQLLLELRHGGSVNALAARPRGLTSPARLARVERGFEREPNGTRLSASVELVYGHAWTADRPAAVTEPGIARIPLGRIGRRR